MERLPEIFVIEYHTVTGVFQVEPLQRVMDRNLQTLNARLPQNWLVVGASSHHSEATELMQSLQQQRHPQETAV